MEIENLYGFETLELAETLTQELDELRAAVDAGGLPPELAELAGKLLDMGTELAQTASRIHETAEEADDMVEELEGFRDTVLEVVSELPPAIGTLLHYRGGFDAKTLR